MVYDTQEQAIADLRATAVLVDGHLSAQKFEDECGRSRLEVIRLFESWNDAKRAAGLKTKRPKNGVSNKEKRRRVQMIKEVIPCKRCNEIYPPPVMEFHHRDRKDKKFHIRSGGTRRWDDVKSELKKCDLLCANCHRIKEHVENE